MWVRGNVEVESFALMLDRLTRRAGQEVWRRFVDLGSGYGVAVLTAAMFPFKECVGGLAMSISLPFLACFVPRGFEISPEYHAAARELLLAASQESFTALESDRSLLRGDVLTEDWSDASLVFANCVTWPKQLVAAVARKALRLPVGALVVSGKRFPNEKEVMRGFDFRGEACLGDWTPWLSMETSGFSMVFIQFSRILSVFEVFQAKFKRFCGSCKVRG